MISHIADQLRLQIAASDATIARAGDDRVTIAPQSERRGLRIEIRERGTADLEVSIFVPDKRGSPFEVIFVGPQAEEEDVAAAAVRLVCDLVNERSVLGWNPGFWGGRQFIGVGELSSETRRPLSWIVSWRGTHNWDASDV